MTRFVALWLSILLVSQSIAADISIEDFVKFTAYRSVQLSPDGNRLAVTVPQGDTDLIAILDISDTAAIKPKARLQLSEGESVAGLFWANDQRIVFLTARQLGSLNQPRSTGRIFAMDADGRRMKQIYGIRDAAYVFRYADIIDRLPERPDHILVAGYTNDREYPVAEVVNINGGSSRTQTRSPLRRGGLVADANGEARFAFGITDDFEQSFGYRAPGQDKWRIFDNPFPGEMTPVAFDKDDKHLIINSRGKGAMGLFRLSPDSGDYKPLVTHQVAEVHAVLRDPGSKAVIGAEFLPDYPQVQFIDPESPAAIRHAGLTNAFPGHQLRITSESEDGQRTVIGVGSDRLPFTYYLFDAQTNSARYLFASRPWIDAKEMSAREAFWITARDGVELQGYLTHPQGNDDSVAPFVVVVHGGPHGIRDTWAYDTQAQLLANRGYRVMQLNYRGSGGRGDAFEELGYLHWGTAMQDDVTDATLWAIQEGLAQRGQICIYGASYGGYAVLSGITREPDLYDCAFAFVGVYDLELLKRRGNVPQLLGYGPAFLDTAVGTDREDLKSRSPINYVDKIKTPLYLVHGILDRQAHVDNYYSLCKALDKQGIPYQKLLVKGEAHGFYKVENRIKLYEELLGFLDQHIGNKAPTAGR